MIKITWIFLMMKMTPTRRGENTDHFTKGGVGNYFVLQGIGYPNPETPPKKLELYIL